MTKRIVFAIAVLMSAILSGCEGLGGSNFTVSNPREDDVEFNSSGAFGDKSTGRVSIYISCTSKKNEIDEVYFGSITATGGGKSYTNGSVGYVGNVETPKDEEVWVAYESKYQQLADVNTDLTTFDKVTVEFDLKDGSSIHELVFKNMPIEWE